MSDSNITHTTSADLPVPPQHPVSSVAASSPPTSSHPQPVWKPMLNRAQSWDTQDMKHQMQSRLTGLEKGKESGFTETEKRTGS